MANPFPGGGPHAQPPRYSPPSPQFFGGGGVPGERTPSWGTPPHLRLPATLPASPMPPPPHAQPMPAMPGQQYGGLPWAGYALPPLAGMGPPSPLSPYAPAAAYSQQPYYASPGFPSPSWHALPAVPYRTPSYHADYPHAEPAYAEPRPDARPEPSPAVYRDPPSYASQARLPPISPPPQVASPPPAPAPKKRPAPPTSPLPAKKPRPPPPDAGRRPTACLLCRKRKRQCDGGDPCQRCAKMGLRCAYEEGEVEVPTRKTACAECHRNKKTCVGAVFPEGAEVASEPCTRCVGRGIPCELPTEGTRKKGGAAAASHTARSKPKPARAPGKRVPRPAAPSLDVESDAGTAEVVEDEEVGTAPGYGHFAVQRPGYAAGYPSPGFSGLDLLAAQTDLQMAAPFAHLAPPADLQAPGTTLQPWHPLTPDPPLDRAPSLSMLLSLALHPTPLPSPPADADPPTAVPVPLPFSPSQLRPPMPAACIAAHLLHFFENTHRVFNAVHPRTFLRLASTGHADPALYWTLVAFSSLTCAHCPSCSTPDAKRAAVSRAAWEVVARARPLLSVPRTEADRPARVRAAQALLLQAALAASVRNGRALHALRAALEALMYGPGSVGVAEGLPWPGAGVAGAWVLAEEASRTWWIARNFVALLGDVEEPVWGVGAGPAAPPGAWLPCADPDFEAVHEGMDPAGLPPPVTAGEAFGFLLLGEPHGQRALAAEQVPLLLARGSIAGNSAVATCVAMLTDLRAMTAREGVTWRAAKARADAGPPWDTDPASRAGDAMRALIGGMDALLAGLPAHVASALETGDAAGLERIFSRAWGAPSGEKFAHQMLVLLGAQCAARSHMAVGREPGCDPQEEAEDERAFLASPSFPEAAAHAVAGVQLAKAMFEANPSPTFLGPHSAVAMLRLGSVLLLSQRALEASDPAAAALSAGLAATCARLMRLTLAHAPYKAHGARISRELLERAEGAGRAVGDVVAEAAGVLQAVDG